MTTPEKRAKISAKVQQDLEKRSKQGMWALPLCMALVSVTTGLGQRAPRLMWGATALLLVQAIWRCCAIRQVLRRPRRWRGIHAGLLLTCSAVWGVVPGVAIFRFGYSDRDVLILLLYHATVAFGTVNLLVHDKRLIGGALTLLFGPLMVGHLLSGVGVPLHCLSAAVLYLLYCVFQGKKLNEIYMEHISDHYELSVAAYRDCLTGLPNRLHMRKLLEESLEAQKQSRRELALLYIDLDGFKQINDRHSHKVGDLFLCEVASRISRCLRAGAVAARIGGDEFTILLPECESASEAIGLANRVLRAAREPVEIEGLTLHYSTSIGVSLYPSMAPTSELLVRSADEAMYLAKSSGKDRVCMAPGASPVRTLEGTWECSLPQMDGRVPGMLLTC